MPKSTVPDWKKSQIKMGLAKGESYRSLMARFGVSSTVVRSLTASKSIKQQVDEAVADAQKLYKPPPEAKPAQGDFATVATALKKRPLTLAQIAEHARASEAEAKAWVETKRAEGINLVEIHSGLISLETQPIAKPYGHAVLDIYSDDEDSFTLGAMGDTHLASKYERLDILNDLYDRYEQAGVKEVFHTGNWVDGEARFNKHDLLAHGMDGQIRYLAEKYPKRTGIHTYAVAGDDHEGWWCQREGVDIGRYAQQIMRLAGHAWTDLGYMEAFVRLINRKSGQCSMLHVIHPGGGSAYATSYTVQKIVESYGGGEKPAVMFAGHYHKMELINIRNVWCVQTGTTQDQTPFMRKKKLEAHMGGHIIRLKQDPKTGAIISMNGMLRYFDRGYYNNRWSMSGGIVQPPAYLNGVVS